LYGIGGSRNKIRVVPLGVLSMVPYRERETIALIVSYV
jgi:hypothetical protein